MKLLPSKDLGCIALLGTIHKILVMKTLFAESIGTIHPSTIHMFAYIFFSLLVFKHHRSCINFLGTW